MQPPNNFLRRQPSSEFEADTEEGWRRRHREFEAALPPPMFDPMLPVGEWSWPPIWESLEESPQFKVGLLKPYLDLEGDILRLGATTITQHQRVLRFLQQVRDGRGYDLDMHDYPSECMGFPFTPKPSPYDVDDARYLESTLRQIEFAVDKLNYGSQNFGEGKFYEYNGRIENIVGAHTRRMNLITFTVKETVPNAAVEVKTVRAMLFFCGRSLMLLDLSFKP